MPSIINSGVHWVDPGGVCHYADIVAGTDDDASIADIDAHGITVVILGQSVVLTTRHARAVQDPTGAAPGKWHYAPRCGTGPSPGY